MQAQVFEALLKGRSALERLRFLLTIDLKELHHMPTLLQAIAQEARLIDLPAFIHMIEHEECLIPTAQLLALSHACNSRAHRRLHGSSPRALAA